MRLQKRKKVKKKRTIQRTIKTKILYGCNLCRPAFKSLLILFFSIPVFSQNNAANVSEPQYQLNGDNYQNEAASIQQMFYNVTGSFNKLLNGNNLYSGNSTYTGNPNFSGGLTSLFIVLPPSTYPSPVTCGAGGLNLDYCIGVFGGASGTGYSGQNMVFNNPPGHAFEFAVAGTDALVISTNSLQIVQPTATSPAILASLGNGSSNVPLNIVPEGSAVIIGPSALNYPPQIGIWAQSVDGASENAGCVGVMSANSSSQLIWSSTTTASVPGLIATTLGTCAPNSVCQFVVWGQSNVQSNSGGTTLGDFATTSTTRCDISNVSGPPGGGQFPCMVMRTVVGSTTVPIFCF